jgi:predicted phage replisome organizer
MADVKWIKITTDIFDDEKILLIESLPDSYAIITVWFKLLCLAGKQNNSGVFMMGRIPYTDKMLATIFRMKESTVTMALQTFEQFGMVEIVDGVITIPNWGKHQNLDQLESKKEYMRGYMKEYREKQKALTSGKSNSKTNSKANVSQADKEEDKEIEIETDIEKEKKRESRKKQPDIFTLFEKIYSEYNFSDSLILKIREWLTYKAERKESYAEQGLKSLLTQIKKKCAEYSEIAVCELIDECMANNWKGIIFDKLKGKENKAQNPNKSYDLDEFFEAAVARSWEELQKENPPKTAGNDPEVRKKVEEMKEKFKS